MRLIAGCDEAGRGPLAGPVVAAAVILPKHYDLPGLTDSKKLSEKKREQLYQAIMQTAVSAKIAIATPDEIDTYNILQASLLAMKRAIEQLSPQPQHVLIDGNQAPKIAISTETIIKGDLSEPCISAASICAKVYRDRLMLEYDSQYPQYGFKQHKGYPTKAHRLSIAQYGFCEIHRSSFRVAQVSDE